MSAKRIPPKDIDEYIAGFPADVRRVLEEIRSTVKRAAPDAEETIKYGMPAFTLAGNLVYFAAFKKHIGFFPPVKGDDAFNNEALVYEGPKGSFRFPLDAPLPLALIARIVKLRVKENLGRAGARKRKR